MTFEKAPKRLDWALDKANDNLAHYSVVLKGGSSLSFGNSILTTKANAERWARLMNGWVVGPK